MSVSLFVASVLSQTTPILLAALAAMFTQRANILNVAVEGMMLAAAMTAIAVGDVTGSVGLSTLQSRACAGLAKGKLIFALPGSNGACKDGWDKLIRWQLDSRHRPCNFIEIMPRLNEK